MEIREYGVFRALIVKVKIICGGNMTQFWSYMYDASYTDVLPNYSIIEVWKLKSQEYKKDNLHSTFTLTV